MEAAREGLVEGATCEPSPWRKCGNPVQLCFWSKGIVYLRVPKWEYAWCVQGIARTPVADQSE